MRHSLWLALLTTTLLASTAFAKPHTKTSRVEQKAQKIARSESCPNHTAGAHTKPSPHQRAQQISGLLNKSTPQKIKAGKGKIAI